MWLEKPTSIVAMLRIFFLPITAKGGCGIYDHNVRREILGDSAVKDKTVNELIRFVEAKEAARDAAIGGRPAAATAAATSSYK